MDLIHNTTTNSLNATRMGFAWMNEKESEKASKPAGKNNQRKKLAGIFHRLHKSTSRQVTYPDYLIYINWMTK